MFDVETFIHLAKQENTVAVILTKTEDENKHLEMNVNIDIKEHSIDFISELNDEVLLTMTDEMMENIEIMQTGNMLKLNDEFMLVLYELNQIQF